MKVWLDDIRPMPCEFDIHVKTAKEAILLLQTVVVDLISFDHDLGDEENGTGYDVARFIEEAAYFGDIDPIAWNVHSANPVGRKNIESAMQNSERYWKKYNDSNKHS